MNLTSLCHRQEAIWVDKRQLAKAISLSTELFKILRLGRKGQNGKPDTPPVWTEGIHYQKIGSRKIVYNLRLIENWVATRHSPREHELSIEIYNDGWLDLQDGGQGFLDNTVTNSNGKNQHTKVEGKTYPQPKTAEKLAEQHKISKPTIERDAQTWHLVGLYNTYLL